MPPGLESGRNEYLWITREPSKSKGLRVLHGRRNSVFKYKEKNICKAIGPAVVSASGYFLMRDRIVEAYHPKCKRYLITLGQSWSLLSGLRSRAVPKSMFRESHINVSEPGETVRIAKHADSTLCLSRAKRGLLAFGEKRLQLSAARH